MLPVPLPAIIAVYVSLLAALFATNSAPTRSKRRFAWALVAIAFGCVIWFNSAYIYIAFTEKS